LGEKVGPKTDFFVTKSVLKQRHTRVCFCHSKHSSDDPMQMPLADAMALLGAPSDYDRADIAAAFSRKAKKRPALETWAAFLDRLCRGADNVAELGAYRRG
jgi:hypothetical protein